MAEYAGLIKGLQYVLSLGITELFVTGDSQIILTQVTGRKQRHAAHLQASLNEVKIIEAKIGRVNYLHLLRRYNGAADFLAADALRTKTDRVVEDDETKAVLSNLNKLPEGVYIPDDPVSSADIQSRVVCMALDHPSLDLADVDSDDGGGDEEEVNSLEMSQLEIQLKRSKTEVVTTGEVCKLLGQCYPEDKEIANAATAAIASGEDPAGEQECTRVESIQQETNKT
jgi:hypothetical protein